jgi:hypothetical protein
VLLRFQLSDRALAEMLRARFQRQGACMTDRVDNNTADPRYIDHVTFSGTASPFTSSILERGGEQSVTVPQAGAADTTLKWWPVILNRPVLVVTTTLSQLEAALNGTPATQDMPVLPLRFALSVEHIDRTEPDHIRGGSNRIVSDRLKVSFAGLGPVEESLFTQFGITRAEVEQKLQQLVPKEVNTPLDFAAALGSFASGPIRPQVVWSGLALSTDQQRAEIRAEVQYRDRGVDDVETWRRFYTGEAVDDLLGTDAWALLIDRELVVAAVWAAIDPAVRNAKGFTLKSGPSYSWDPALPGVQVAFSGKALEACQCAWGKIDVDVDATARVAFQLQGNLLRTDVRLDHRSNKAQLLCCELTAAALWLVIDIKGLFEADTRDLAIGPLEMFVHAVIKAAHTPTSAPTPATFTKASEGHFYADQSVTFSLNSEDETYLLTGVYGDSTGLRLRGAHNDLGLRQARLSGTIVPFAWLDPDFDCSAVKGEFTAHAEVVLEKEPNTGELEPEFCDARVTTPDFAPLLTVSYDYAPYRVHLNFDTTRLILGSARVLAFSHGGVRLFQLPQMPALTQEQRDDLGRKVFKWRAAHCFTLEDPWFKYFHSFNPKWLVDPAPKLGEWQQRWQIGFGGLHAGDRVVFSTVSGEHILTAVATTSGQAAGEFISPEQSLTMVREPAAEADLREDARPPGFTLRSVLLQRIATLQVPATIFAMQGLRSAGGDELTIATSEGALRFGIEANGRASLLGHWSGPLAGAATLSGRLYGWSGEGNLVDLSRASGAAVTAAAPIGAAANIPRALDFRAVHVGDAFNALVAASGKNVILLTAGKEQQRFELEADVVRVGNNVLVAARPEGGFYTYTLGLEGEVELTSVSAQVPPEAITARAGRWIAMPTERPGEIELITVVAHRMS